MTAEVLTRRKRVDAGTLGDELQATLVELIELSLQGKQAHWNVTGPLFRSVHHELDEIVETARWASDEVAERMATLELAPDGRSVTVAEAGPFPPFPEGSLAAERAVELVGRLLDELTDRLRNRMARLDSDLVSQGILVAVAERLEKHAWMLRAQRS